MKKFKDFIKKSATKNDAYVPDEPIHFKMGYNSRLSTKNDAYVPDKPIHFKHVSKLKEETEDKDHIKTWTDHNENKHLGHSSEDISKTLVDHVKKNHDLNKKQIDRVNLYSNNSKSLSYELIKAHKNKSDLTDYNKTVTHHLDSATNKPIGHETHLYSGLGFNPAKMTNENGHVHLPAYMSLTHDKTIAHKFALKPHEDAVTAKEKKETHDIHILHLHMKESDKGLHISHLSEFSKEHETILPRNTTIKVHHEPTVYYHEGRKVHIWHAKIEHQD